MNQKPKLQLVSSTTLEDLNKYKLESIISDLADLYKLKDSQGHILTKEERELFMSLMDARYFWAYVFDGKEKLQ